MLACKFRASKDKAGNQPKIVYMFSSYNQPNFLQTGQKDRDGNDITKPAIVHEYNLHMGGLDRIDQQLHDISPLRKSYQ